MTDADFTRVLNAVEGFWPRSPLKPNAQRAWRFVIDHHEVTAVLTALSAYATEGHPYPPIAGQLAARLKPAIEPSSARVARQRDYASELVRTGSMSRDDFDWYETNYWSVAQ